LKTIDWPFFGGGCNIRGQYREKRTKGLYQWLTQRASYFRSVQSNHGAGCIVRTEVTVERQGTTLLVGNVSGFDTCPLCGQKLAPAQSEQARLRLHGS